MKKLISATLALMIIVLALATPVYAESTTNNEDFSDTTALTTVFADKTIVCLGDSLTVGSQSVGGTYPIRLNRTLQTNNINASVINSGASGEQTDHVIPLLPTRVDAYTPDYVFLLLGTNDMRFGEYGNTGADPKTVAAYSENMTQIITQIVDNNTGVEVILFTIPPIANYVNGNWTHHQNYNAEIAANLSTVNGTTITQIDLYNYLNTTGNDTYIASDNIHLNDWGYKVIADLAANYLLDGLSYGIETGSGLMFNGTGTTENFRYDDLDERWTFSNENGTNSNAGNFLAHSTKTSDQYETINGTFYFEGIIEVHYIKNANSGIATVKLNGTTLGTFDAYAAVLAYNQSSIFVIPDSITPGVYELEINITSKHASAVQYDLYLDYVKTNYTMTTGQAISNQLYTSLGDPTGRITIYPEERTSITAFSTPYENNCNNSPSGAGAGAGIKHIYSSPTNITDQHNSGSGTDANVTFTIYGYGTVRIYYVATTTTGWTRIYVDDTLTHSFNASYASLVYNKSQTFNLGTFGEHTIRINKPSNVTAMFIHGIQYTTYNYIWFTSTDQDTWTLTNTTTTTFTANPLYYKFIFNGNATINYVNVTWTGTNPTIHSGIQIATSVFPLMLLFLTFTFLLSLLTLMSTTIRRTR